MEDYRSKSYADGRMQMENYQGGRSTTYGMRDLRSYSTTYASSAQQTQMDKEVKADGRMQIVNYHGSRSTTYGMRDLRSYSTSYASSAQQTQMDKEVKFNKSKSTVGSKKAWGLMDPEMQRKKRVASYKVYSVEGKVKGSLRKSFRWLKDRYTQVVYGWW